MATRTADGGGSVSRRVLQLLAITLWQALLLFASAGTLAWAGAWWYLSVYLTLLVIAGMVLRGHREVVAERSKGTRGSLPRDRLLTRLLAATSMSVLVVSGLAVRFGWPGGFGLGVRIAGVVLLTLGYVPVLWAMATNRFFTQGVCIQREREHVTITGGPYRFVRHPGYAGMIISMVGAVALLGTPWAVIPLMLYAIVLLARTQFEDETLAAQLTGYPDYRTRTRYRLVPGLW